MTEELNKETLKRLYVVEQKSLREIAKIYGCSAFRIRYRCLKYRIKLRPKSEKRVLLKKSVLQRLYVQENKSPREIAQIFTCTPDTVHRRLRQYGIPLKAKKSKGITKSLLHKLYIKEGKTTREIAQIIGCSRETIRYICKQLGIPLRKPGSKGYDIDGLTLRRLYIKEGKNLTEIAKMFGCAVRTISKRVKRFGLIRK